MQKIIHIFIVFVVFISCRNDVPTKNISIIYNNEFPEDFKLCLTADTGTGEEDQKRVAKAMLNEGCSQVRILGDVVYNNGLEDSSDPQFFEKFYDPYEDLFNAGANFYLLMGNHDYMGRIDAWSDLSAKHPQINFPNLFYAEIWGNVCIISLGTDYYLSGRQLSWAIETLDEMNGRCEFAIGLGHHPYKSVGKHGDAIGFVKSLLEKVIVGHVDLYVSGHDHNLADEGVYEETRFLVSGAGGKVRSLKNPALPGNFALSELGYIVLTFGYNLSNELVSNYKLRTLDKDNNVSTVRENNIIGQGIRSN